MCTRDIAPAGPTAMDREPALGRVGRGFPATVFSRATAKALVHADEETGRPLH